MASRAEFASRLQRLIEEVEAWSYADSDSGAGLPVQVAQQLRVLATAAPSAALEQGLRRAQDALDDGLSAEAIAAALYRVRAELEPGGPQVSRPPSPSG